MTYPSSLVASTQPSPLNSGSGLVAAGRRGLPIAILALLSYFALFRLPFYFPPRQRLMSASYAFGFNNTVAILAMAALLGVVTLLYLFRFRRRETIELQIEFPRERAMNASRAIKIAFTIVVLCYTLLTWAMYIYNVRVAPPLMWETRHLLHRTLL